MAMPHLLRRWMKNRLSLGNPRKKTAPRNKTRLLLEALENRVVPATNITILATANGTGTLDAILSPVNGTITTADDPGDPAATLSRGALENVGPGVTISITADNTISFNDLGALNLQTGGGINAGFVANTGPVSFANVANTVITAGGSISFSAGTDLTVSNLNSNGGNVNLTAGTAGAGNLTFENILTSGSGNLTFQATNAAGGMITQGGSPSVASGQVITANATGNVTVDGLRGTTVSLASNIGSVNSAGSNTVQASTQLAVSAATGITLNTLAASLTAKNNPSGDINITQAASPAQTLAITGAGVVNNAASGAINLTNLGADITIAGGATVKSNAGNVTLAATGFTLNGAVNSGVAATALANSIPGFQFDLGTKTPGKIGLTATELNNVTAGVLRIGSA
ncbi:MAG TPA: hypothetical protein VGY58_05410, partial [Gemmataceae bacterium]|nr:hypothetical protein [Gemmataceae bacterium]